MPTVELSSGEVYLAEHSPAEVRYPPLILLHGAGGTRLDWSPHIRRLPGLRVIAVDLPAHGKSTGESCTSIPAYAGIIRELLNVLAIQRAVIAGHSMGGAIAQQLALTAPSYAAGLILMGTGSKLPVEPSLTERIIKHTDQALDWLVEWAWSDQVSPEIKQLARQRMAHTPPEVLRDDFIACQSFDVRDQLEHIAAPVLVLGARDDRMVPLKFSHTLAERIPRATLVVIERSGHMFPIERGEEVAAHMDTWLAEHL